MTDQKVAPRIQELGAVRTLTHGKGHLEMDTRAGHRLT